jgi:uncharacterized phiE125 gp8 family phage protein
MQIKIDTAPTQLPITLEDAKEHLSIYDENDDGYVNLLIAAATDMVEQITMRRLFTQTWIAYFDKWPTTDYIRLPFGQLQSVTSVKYLDSDQAVNTMTASEYTVDTTSEPGRVVLNYGESWPTETLHTSNPIYIEFVCGYTSEELIPQRIQHAIKLKIADMWENRESVVVGTIVSEFKGAVYHLLRPSILDGVYP